MSNTSTIHIKTDFDCRVYDYGQELGTTKADTYFNIELRRGEHELTFAYTEDESISKTINYTIEDADCDYRLIVKIAEVIFNKAKESVYFKNYSMAYSLFSIAAEKGSAKAQFSLGVCFEYGKGVDKDLAKAVAWFTKSAEQGNIKAQNALGICYYTGKGVKKDFAKAFCLTLKKVDTIVNKNGENQKETEEIQSRRKNGDGEASLSRRGKSK